MKPALDLKIGVLMALVISYFVLVGADMYGQSAIAWTVLEAPPRSLSMFQGEYVYDGGPFWRVSTTITLVLLVLALAVNWRTSRRGLLIFALGTYFVINAFSFAYIFPEYLDIVGSPYSDTINQALVDRGAQWKRMAMTRWVIVVLCGLPILAALARPASEPDA